MPRGGCRVCGPSVRAGKKPTLDADGNDFSCLTSPGPAELLSGRFPAGALARGQRPELLDDHLPVEFGGGSGQLGWRHSLKLGCFPFALHDSRLRKELEGYVNPGLGRAALPLGRLDDARRLGDRAVESSPRQPGFATHALHLLGDVATHPDRFDAERGEAHYRQALALAEPRGMRPLVAHCHLGLAKLYRRTGKRPPAHEHLTTATTMYREMDMRYWLAHVEREGGPSAI